MAKVTSRVDEWPIVIIRPSKGLVAPRLREAWEYRELLYFLAWRDIKVRYKQTVLGAAWAIIQPFFMMIIFSIVFGRLAKIPSDGLPYPLFAYCALLPWQLFARALTESSNSLVGSQNLITKVYFPRLVIPVASILGGLADFVVAFVILLGMMAYYNIIPTAALMTLPLFLLLDLTAALGMGLWLSALNVQYRDIRYVIPFLTQFGLFITPVVYPASLVPEEWRAWLGLNPIASVVEGFRWALLGTGRIEVSMVTISVLTAIVLLVSGMYYFGRMERSFADVI